MKTAAALLIIGLAAMASLSYAAARWGDRALADI